jgi:putative FmdB family regulatory protein
MPTYEYQCSACGCAFERFQPITADPVRRCPVCGKSKVKRLIGTGGGVIFKGSGFYATDYRSESYKKGASAETSSTATATGDGKAGAKTETGESKLASKQKKGPENRAPPPRPPREPREGV